MKIVHFCAGLEEWNGMANTARQFVCEERAKGYDSLLTNDIKKLTDGVDQVAIHGAWLPVLWMTAKKAKSVGARLVIRPAGSYDPVRLAYHGWKKRLVSPFEHLMLRRADVLLATCEAEVQWIREYEPRVKKVEVTDLKRFFKLSKLNTVNRLDSVRKGFHLLYLGRRHPLKGLPYLQAVWYKYYNKCSAEMRVVSTAIGAELEKVWDWCDVLVLPTLSENFGRVIAEALERGKRVITTDGAPAWGDGNTYGGRLIYLKGFRDGSNEDRVRMLKEAIANLMGEIDARTSQN